MKLALKLLFDVVYPVFLSQTGTNEQVAVNKFKLMVVVYRNLDITWARILLSNIKDEVKKIVSKFDDKCLLRELNVKKRFNFCTKISLTIHANFEWAEWNGLVLFCWSRFK